LPHSFGFCRRGPLRIWVRPCSASRRIFEPRSPSHASDHVDPQEIASRLSWQKNQGHDGAIGNQQFLPWLRARSRYGIRTIRFRLPAEFGTSPDRLDGDPSQGFRMAAISRISAAPKPFRR
jgi:hypothetical protein